MNDRKPSITATLSVRNGRGAIDLYKAAFGATELFRVEDDGGSVVAQLSVAGAAQVAAVEEGHGWRLGRIVDPFGHHWEIAKHVG